MRSIRASFSPVESSTWDRKLIIRLPRFSMEYFQQGMEVIWRNPDFREALLIAAPSWIAQLNWEQHFNDLPLKLQHTLWKYANRMCHRSTPFGAFTGMGVWTWEEKADLYIEPSAYETLFLREKEHSLTVNPYLNNLTYPFGDGLRYFIQEKGAYGKPWKMKELSFLPNAQQLFKGQLLSHPYLSLFKEIGLVQDQIQQVSFEAVDIHQFKGAEGDLSHTLYQQQGALPENFQYRLSQGMQILERLSPSLNIEPLREFKRAFQKRFEYRSVPVLEALDPDLGVGYPIGIQKNEPSWSPLHGFLMEQWMYAKEQQNRVLDLDAKRIFELLPAPDINRSAPNSAVLFSVLKDQLWLKQVCPLGSIPLIARMIPFDPKLKDMVKGFILREKEQQPEVIHADIIYQGEEVMDKVSLPYGLRPYQLVLSPVQGTHPEMLNWNDLVLRMQGNDLILYSLKYQRQVIPHLNSAYNSHRDEMPLFRLLVDLQYEGLKLPSPFHLKHFFPGLSHYPRVTCSKVIIQPACWIIANELLKQWKSLKYPEDQLKVFEDYANQEKLPYRFLWKIGDQGLVFDRNNKMDMEVFRSLWYKYPELMLEEQVLDEGNSALQEQNGKEHFAHEFIAFHFQKGQRPPHRVLISDISTEGEQLNPEWLSLYVYLEPEQQDRFLADHILPLVKHQLPEIDFPFQQWYFLRFADDLGAHLRIRFKCSSEEQVINGWKMLQCWNKVPYVKKVSLHPYLPEISRYHYLGIRKTESLFLKSSKSALLMLHNEAQHRLAYALCCLWMIFLKCPEIKNLMDDLLDSYLIQHHKKQQWNNEFREIKPLLLKYYPIWSVKDPFLKAMARLEVLDAQGSPTTAYFISIFHMHINRLFQTQQLETERCCYYLFPKLLPLFKAKQLYPPADGKHSETFP